MQHMAHVIAFTPVFKVSLQILLPDLTHDFVGLVYSRPNQLIFSSSSSPSQTHYQHICKDKMNMHYETIKKTDNKLKLSTQQL